MAMEIFEPNTKTPINPQKTSLKPNLFQRIDRVVVEQAAFCPPRNFFPPDIGSEIKQTQVIADLEREGLIPVIVTKPDEEGSDLRLEVVMEPRTEYVLGESGEIQVVDIYPDGDSVVSAATVRDVRTLFGLVGEIEEKAQEGRVSVVIN